MPTREETVVPFETSKHLVRQASMVRSTWLASSQRALRERGYLERYFAALPPIHREALTGVVAGSWLPIEIGLAHYEACERLDLPESEVLAMGKEVTSFAHKTSYALALRLATSAGVTPWSCFSLQQRIWSQVWNGGAVAIYKLGDHEARIEVAGWPCARFRYCRIAIRGLLVGQTELFCRKARAEDVQSLCTPLTVGYRVTWT